MSFAAVLHEIARGCGAVGAALLGSDGIPIESVRGEAAPESPVAEELDTAGVEFGRILVEIRKASDSVGGGAVEEAALRLARVALVLRPVDEDTFVLVALPPDGNLGKARYLLRRHLDAIRREL